MKRTDYINAVKIFGRNSRPTILLMPTHTDSYGGHFYLYIVVNSSSLLSITPGKSPDSEPPTQARVFSLCSLGHSFFNEDKPKLNHFLRTLYNSSVLDIADAVVTNVPVSKNLSEVMFD